MDKNDSYPRDLIGYAGRPPDPDWPGNARIAVSMVLNYEEGGEYNILHGDAHSEFVLTDVGGEPLAERAESQCRVEFRIRQPRRLLGDPADPGERRVAATVYAVGMALERNPPAAAELAASGFEVACHGHRWIDYQSVPEPAERRTFSRTSRP